MRLAREVGWGRDYNKINQTEYIHRSRLPPPLLTIFTTPSQRYFLFFSFLSSFSQILYYFSILFFFLFSLFPQYLLLLSLSHTHTHAHTRAHTHTHTRTHTHTHTHTHTLVFYLSPSHSLTHCLSLSQFFLFLSQFFTIPTLSIFFAAFFLTFSFSFLFLFLFFVHVSLAFFSLVIFFFLFCLFSNFVNKFCINSWPMKIPFAFFMVYFLSFFLSFFISFFLSFFLSPSFLPSLLYPSSIFLLEQISFYYNFSNLFYFLSNHCYEKNISTNPNEKDLF